MSEAIAKAMNDALRETLKRLHYPLGAMLVCLCRYAAYPLSPRHIDEMIAERGVFVDHVTINRWAAKILPMLAAAFHRRKRPSGKSWRPGETKI